MSKKLASGSDIILLDVKFGTGAFMKTKEDALLLAEKMVNIGNRAGKSVGALITDMEQPLSDHIGNALEIVNIIDVLKGKKSRLYNELKEVAVKLLSLTDKYDEQSATVAFDEAIDSAGLWINLPKWSRLSTVTKDIFTIPNCSSWAKCCLFMRRLTVL